MAWEHGTAMVNGQLVETSWRTRGGVATHINLAAADPAAVVSIGGVEYAVENLSFEDRVDGVTVPLVPRAEMDARVAAAAEAQAKAKAEFEGKPWPPVKQKKGADGEQGKG